MSAKTSMWERKIHVSVIDALNYIFIFNKIVMQNSTSKRFCSLHSVHFICIGFCVSDFLITIYACIGGKVWTKDYVCLHISPFAPGTDNGISPGDSELLILIPIGDMSWLCFQT